MPKTTDAGGLSPLAAELVSVVGRRADDPAVVAFVTERLGQKAPPTATTDTGGSKYVIAKKFGLELLFSHDVANDKYPLVRKTPKSFVPYLSLGWLKEKFTPLPFGLAFGMDPADVTKCLGVQPEAVPIGLRWERVLDAERDVFLTYYGRECTIGVSAAAELSGRHGVPPLPVVGLFVGWAARRGLMNAGLHAALLAEVAKGERKGSEYVAVACPRGLWDVHLTDKPGLRRFAYQWFHRLGDAGYIIHDLIGVFGSREGPTGHAEPALDADDAAAVAKAAPAFETRFAQWL